MSRTKRWRLLEVVGRDIVAAGEGTHGTDEAVEL